MRRGRTRSLVRPWPLVALALIFPLAGIALPGSLLATGRVQFTQENPTPATYCGTVSEDQLVLVIDDETGPYHWTDPPGGYMNASGAAYICTGSAQSGTYTLSGPGTGAYGTYQHKPPNTVD